MPKNVVRSPSYPVMALPEAIEGVRKIEADYRSSPVDREAAAAYLGYQALSGNAAKALAALASYGLVERAGKGMMRVTPLARDILHPETEGDRATALRRSAYSPRLLQDIRDRFPEHAVPPEDGVRLFLNREGFNPNAISAASRAVLDTMRFLSEEAATEGETERHRTDDQEGAGVPSPGTTFGSAVVGDFIQWEQGGALQLEAPMRVRWVSDDGTAVAVEGSSTGIPMSEVIVESRAPAAGIPMPPPIEDTKPAGQPDGFQEWFRAKVGAGKLITINYQGEDELGPREIEKMIAILTAQKAALED